MTRIPALIRSADPIDHLDLPEGRAERELTALIGSAPPPPATVTRTPRQRGPILVTAVVLALLTAATALITTTVIPREQPANGIDRAQPVVFEGNPSRQAQDRRAIAAMLSNTGTSTPKSRRIAAAISHSLQLRPPPGSQGSGWGRIAGGVGPTRIPRDSSADIEGRPVGGAGTGSDAVTILIVRCSGTGEYRWTVRGHTVQLPLDRTIATATGSCADGITAARYILGAKVVTTSINLDVDAGTSYSIAEIEWGPFASPVLDDPFEG